jgi:hypothetical protein
MLLLLFMISPSLQRYVLVFLTSLIITRNLLLCLWLSSHVVLRETEADCEQGMTGGFIPLTSV